MPKSTARHACVLAALLLAPSLAAAQADPPRDTAQPPGMEELKIPSHGTQMNGFIYLAQGAGTHGVVVFLHGYPGNERNLDLAQAVRRAGWHALYFDYRGSWGSGGTFGFQNALDDIDAVLSFLRANAARFRIDTGRVALVGHSFGAWLALQHAAADPGTACTAALDAWNLGAFGKDAAEHPERDPGAYFRQTTDAESGPIRGNAAAMLRETVINAARWDYRTLAPRLRSHAVFLAASTRDAEAMRATLTQSLQAAGAAHVRSIHYDDDHGFSAHRIALADELVRWLSGDCAAVQGGRTAASATPGFSSQHNYVPPAGVVSDSTTAVAIAEAVLVPIYGRRQIESERPLVARLQDDRWSVMGSLPKGMLGGIAEVEISRRDGRILRITHGR